MSQALREAGLSARKLARAATLSRSAAARLVTHGQWPARDADARQRVRNALCAHGVATERAAALTADTPQQKAPGASTPEAAPITPSQPAQDIREEPMLLPNVPLSPKALRHFQLSHSPFEEDIQSADDIFKTASMRVALQTMRDTLRSHGFAAIVGESGAGKTTVRELFEEQMLAEMAAVIIRPHVLAMEATDTKGKTLRASHLAEAITYKLDPAAQIKSSPQARFSQAEELLAKSHQAGRRHLLVIEEAHCLPLATLKHLKRFRELKRGLSPLVGVLLIGQTELEALLRSQNPEVREATQRCQIKHIDPLDSDLEAYLAHKFQRFGIKPETVFSPEAIGAIRERLIYRPRGAKEAISTCYPLAVNNLVALAMNNAAAIGYPKVDADCVRGAV
ncbi:MAG TPA: AAA family ATPase [Burkholderiaceae bacterium]|nr:AAA family ATPase [Burkholderiaceae bacterium]